MYSLVNLRFLESAGETATFMNATIQIFQLRNSH